MKKILNNKLINKLIKAVSIILFIYIILCLLFIDTNIKYTYSNNAKCNNYIFFLLALIVITLLSVISKKEIIKKLENKNEIIIFFMFAILFILQIVIEKNIYFETSWDAEHILIAVKGFIKTGVFENNTYYDIYPYFSVYPNNLFLAGIFSCIGKIVTKIVAIERLNECLVYIGIILVDFSGIIMVKTIGNLTEKKIVKIYAATIFVILIGLSPWFMIPYSDVYSLIFPISILYNYTKKEKIWNNYLAIGILSYIGYLIKPTVIISIIAIGIIESYKLIFSEKNISVIKKDAKKIALFLIGLILIYGLKLGIINFINYNVDKDYSFSFWHYLMMGVNLNKTGCFNSDDVQTSLGFDTYETRVQYNKTEFFERIKSMSVKDFVIFYTKKILVNYNDGTFAWGREGGFYKTINDRNTITSQVLRNIFFNKGKLFKIFVFIMQGMWIFVLICTTVKCIYGEFDDYISVIFLSIIGLTIFTLLFEGRARYLYLYSPYYIILATIGMEEIKRMKPNHKKENG